jgi:hypothetical protein
MISRFRKTAPRNGIEIMNSVRASALVAGTSFMVVAAWIGGGGAPAVGACTTAVVASEASTTGTPILWKNRDTPVLSNKVVYVDEEPFAYLCLANARADSGRSCFAGLNDAGFAIINTVAYNVPEVAGERNDREGIIQADALRTCRTVDDFERYLEANLGPELGGQTNIGVFDADGGAALFEVHNHGFERIDAADQPSNYLVNTNFARSGEEGEGEGYIRFKRAEELFRSFPPGGVDPEVILHSFSRDLGHPLLDGPNLSDASLLPSQSPVWINTRDRIDRPSTASAVVIVGGNEQRPATLWVIPGEPLTAAAIPLWVEAGRSPAALSEGARAPLWAESLRIKRGLRPSRIGHTGDYLDLTRLDNADGTGYLPDLLEMERSIFAETADFLAGRPGPEALARYQEQVANRVLDHLASIVIEGAEPPPTPLERNDGARLTTYDELADYLQVLAAASPEVDLRPIGVSGEGREIGALFFSRRPPMEAPREDVLTVLISCQQHGNEPSGKEAALELARGLVMDDGGLLDHLDLILVPQVNPDGSEAGTRRNAADADLNRNHVILSEPEVQAVHDLFLDWMPEVTLDIHETNVSKTSWMNVGYLKDPTEQFGGVSNLNIAEELRPLSVEVIEPGVARRIRDAGVSYHEYIVGGPPEEQRLRFSTTDINDSRQSMGIYNTLSFLFEGKRWDDHTAHIASRTAGQVVAIRSFLETIAANAGLILETVAAARASLTAADAALPPVHIRQDYEPDPERPTVRYPVFDLRTWSSREAELGNFEPKVVPLLTVDRPWGYAIPAEQSDLVALLERHRIRFTRLSKAAAVDAERYRIEGITEVTIEDKEADDITVEVVREKIDLAAGTVIVPVRQPAANLVPLLLEPQSLWAPYGERGGRHLAFDSLLEVGAVFPVARIFEPPE